MLFTSSHYPLIGAHRGASGIAPENTIAAFDLALEQGAELLECDVHRCADGVLVVHHDFDSARTAGTGGEIARMSLAELRALDFGIWRGAAWRDQRIPTLDDVLERYASRVFLNVEIKVDEYRSPGIEEAVAVALDDRSLIERVLVSSFDAQTVARLRQVRPDVQIGMLAEDDPDTAIERAAGLGAVAVHLEAGLITAPRIRQAHALGLSVLAWTVDDEVEMVRLVDLGVDAVLSNYPDRLRTIILARR